MTNTFLAAALDISTLLSLIGAIFVVLALVNKKRRSPLPEEVYSALQVPGRLVKVGASTADAFNSIQTRLLGSRLISFRAIAVWALCSMLVSVGYMFWKYHAITHYIYTDAVALGATLTTIMVVNGILENVSVAKSRYFARLTRNSPWYIKGGALVLDYPLTVLLTPFIFAALIISPLALIHDWRFAAYGLPAVVLSDLRLIEPIDGWFSEYLTSTPLQLIALSDATKVMNFVVPPLFLTGLATSLWMWLHFIGDSIYRVFLGLSAMTRGTIHICHQYGFFHAWLPVVVLLTAAVLGSFWIVVDHTLDLLTFPSSQPYRLEETGYV